MKNLSLSRFLFFLLSLIPLVLNATHLIGGEVVYTCLGGNQYEIKVIIYRDCGPTNTNGTGFDGSGVITIYNMNNGFVDELSHGSVVQEFVVDEFTNECLTLPPELCVEKGTYTIVTTLPNNSQGYQVAYQRCCRNEQVINIVNPEDFGSSLVAYIPPGSDAVCNSSPEFDSYPPMALCLGSDLEISQSATDVDGDSLVYSFVAPFHGSSDMDPTETYPPPYAQVTWAAGYSDGYPMDSNPVIGIDSESGLITGTPIQEGFYVIGIKVEEYRDGVYIGEIVRDFRFLVVDCEIATAAFPIADVYCDGLEVNFENNSLNAFDYYWDFGDLTTTSDVSYADEPSYVYPDSGAYEVTLIANPGSFCSDTAYVSFSLYPDIFPYFDLPPLDCDENATYDFIGEGIIPPNANFSWDFGVNAVNQFSNQLSPENVAFSQEGTQQVSFSVSYLDCDETYEQTFITGGADIVSIEASANELCEPQIVALSANTSSTGDLVYEWDLGNGQIVNVQNPTVQYEPGVYDVSLTVLNTLTGCESSLSEDEWISVYPQPDALFEASVLEGCDPLEVSFTNLSENASDFTWLVNGVVESSSEDFNYLFSSGDFQVNLIASNGYFCSEDDNMLVQITSLPVVEADFQVDYQCNDDLEITIVNNSTSATELVWDFGDETELGGNQSTYNYNNEGEYVVSLIASNPNSCNFESTSMNVISVAQPPSVEFSTYPTADCEAGIVDFQNLSFISSFDNVISWDWDFGDGYSGNGYTTSHIYDDEGVYYVTLSVETEQGCSDSFGENLSIGFLQKPIPNFSFTIDSCTHEVTFLNESLQADEYVWYLDGEISEEISPEMEIDVGNIYDITLVASNEFCTEEYSEQINYNAEQVYKHVIVPNVFTPNGDFENDELIIQGLNECESASLKVYNRWGAEVYHTLSPLVEPWNGFNHSNEVVEGVYYYVLELKYLSKTGSVSIFR